MFCKKILILNSKKEDSPDKKMLTIECDGTSTKGNLKAFGEVKKASLTLGLAINDKILKPVNLQSNDATELSFKLDGLISINDSVCACIFSEEANENFSIFYGSNGNIKKDVLDKLIVKTSGETEDENKNSETEEAEKEMSKQDDTKEKEEMSKENKNEKLKKEEPKKEETEKTEPKDTELELPMDKKFCADKKVENFSKDRNYVVYNGKPHFLSEEAEKESVSLDRNNFYLLIKDQVLEMFSTYPQSNILSDVIKNSKWVKVDYLGDNSYYLLGVIKKDDLVKQIAYAIPTTDQNKVPQDVKEFCHFVALSETGKNLVGDEKTIGFFVMLQNAKTGECDSLLFD